MESLFGKNIICNSYLAKLKKIKYVFANENHFHNYLKTHPEAEDYFEAEVSITLNDDGEFEQKTFEIKKCKPFKAIIVGKVKFSMANLYEQAQQDIFDPYTYGWAGSEYLDAVKVTKTDYIDCYKVYYGLNHSRIVPIEDCELN